MIDVYFQMDKGKGEAIGGISLKEKHPTMGVFIWNTYKVYPMGDNVVLFQRNGHAFVVMNGIHEHEMGTIKIKIIKGLLDDEWMNINVREN